MSTKYSQTKIHKFIKTFIQSKNGELTEQSDENFTVKFPTDTAPIQYTYDPAVARERKSVLITLGSPTFQQILKECSTSGALCRIKLSPRGNYEALLRSYFKDAPFTCGDCDKLVVNGQEIRACETKPCFHQINNGKIVSAKINKTKAMSFFLFYFSVTFQNKLRPRSEETIKVLLDENCNVMHGVDLEDVLFWDERVLVEDSKAKLKPLLFDQLRKVAEQELEGLIEDNVVLFDLPLLKEKHFRLASFAKRLKRERRERVISKRHDFDYMQWQANYDALLKREKESLITAVTAKLSNLLVIDTSNVDFEIKLDNSTTIKSSLILGITQPEVTCPTCRKTFYEGYATQDGFYVCNRCIRQSIDTAKVYSKKATLKLDETLNEYIEADSGFVCSVCAKRHSQLLEFKCSHDNSSVCIYHYDRCDVCGKIFSKANLTYTNEFKQRLCPKHAAKERKKGA